MTRAAVYVRKSRDEEHVADALSLQRDSLLRLAADRGIAEPDVYEEVASGGSLAQRPAMVELLRRVEAGEVDLIIAAHEDRLTRADTLEGAYITHTLAAAGCRVLTLQGEINLADDSHALLWDVKRALSRYELQSYRRRRRAASVERARQGLPANSFNKFGYRWDRERRVYEPDPATYPALKWLFAQAPTTGADRLSREGRAMFGRFPSKYGVLHILSDPFYAGRPVLRWHKTAHGPRLLPADEWVWSESDVDYPHPLTWEEHLRLQEIIAGRRHGRVKSASGFWCTGLCRCPVGHSMFGTGDYYACGQPSSSARHLHIRRNRMEGPVEAVILRMLSDPPLVAAIVERVTLLLSKRETSREDILARLRTAQADVQRYDRLLRSAFEQWADKGISAEQYETWREEYQRGRIGALARVNEATALLAVPPVDAALLAEVRRLARAPERYWAEADPASRRRLARLLIERVDLVDPGPRRRKTVRVHPRW